MQYEPERYWEQRYQRLDLTRSGHCDLPESYNRWLYRRKQAVLERAWRRIGFSLRGQRVLEIGAGMGAYVDFWKRNGARDITGLDLSGAAVAYLTQRYPEHRFLRRDISVPNLQADCGRDYDLVSAIDVLYH